MVARALLQRQQRRQHLGPTIHLAEAVVIVQAHRIVEGGVGALAAHGLDLVAAIARQAGGHGEEGDAAMLALAGAGEQDDIIGHMPMRGEHLLAIDDPLVALAPGCGLE